MEINDRKKLDDALHKSPMVGAEFRYGLNKRTHPDRLKVRGLLMELRVWAKSKVSHDSPQPFLIYSRPRSGTTLLVNLLNQVSTIRCDGELLHHVLFKPSVFLENLPKRAGDVSAYGVKLLSYQLLEIQKVTKPIAFFDKAVSNNYKLIHLTRNTWDQTLSLAKAQETKAYFNHNIKKKQIIKIEPERFLNSLRWNYEMLQYEKEVMSHFDHFKVSYEQHLNNPDYHQEIVNDLCKWFDLSEEKVETTLRRMDEGKVQQTVANITALINIVHKSELKHLLPST